MRGNLDTAFPSPQAEPVVLAHPMLAKSDEIRGNYVLTEMCARHFSSLSAQEEPMANDLSDGDYEEEEEKLYNCTMFGGAAAWAAEALKKQADSSCKVSQNALYFTCSVDYSFQTCEQEPVPASPGPTVASYAPCDGSPRPGGQVDEVCLDFLSITGGLPNWEVFKALFGSYTYVEVSLNLRRMFFKLLL